MTRVKIHAAKTHLSRLIQEVEQGKEVILQRGDKPVAKIVPYQEERPVPKYGALKGQIWMAPDWDETPEEFREYIE